jgi:hypothetical protein
MLSVTAPALDDRAGLNQRRNVMTGKSEVPAARSQALERHELSSEELAAVSGGDKEQADALKEFQQVLQKAGQI